MPSASASHRRVEPSTSVNRNVATPEGAAAAGADTPAECHIRHAATLHIEGIRPRDTRVPPARGLTHWPGTVRAGRCYSRHTFGHHGHGEHGRRTTWISK